MVFGILAEMTVEFQMKKIQKLVELELSLFSK